MTNSNLIDCRPQQDFVEGHPAGSVSLPAGQLFERMHELPMSGTPLILYGDEKSLAKANEFLAARGHVISRSLLLNADLVRQLQLQGCWQPGFSSVRLWQPAGLIRHFVESSRNWQIEPGNGLDIACGSGRNLVFLAENGWSMSGVDYLPDAVKRAGLLADINNVSSELLLIDLEKEGGAKQLQQQFHASLDLVCVLRYLHRPLLSVIDTLLRPGGVILYQTFLQGCEKISRPRNPAYLLRPGELAEQFAAYQVLLDDVEYLADGRPVSAFIARKSLT